MMDCVVSIFLTFVLWSCCNVDTVTSDRPNTCWSGWSYCDNSCGKGTQTRSKTGQITESKLESRTCYDDTCKDTLGSTWGYTKGFYRSEKMNRPTDWHYRLKNVKLPECMRRCMELTGDKAYFGDSRYKALCLGVSFISDSTKKTSSCAMNVLGTAPGGQTFYAKEADGSVTQIKNFIWGTPSGVTHHGVKNSIAECVSVSNSLKSSIGFIIYDKKCITYSNYFEWKDRVMYTRRIYEKGISELWLHLHDAFEKTSSTFRNIELCDQRRTLPNGIPDFMTPDEYLCGRISKLSFRGCKMSKFPTQFLKCFVNVRQLDFSENSFTERIPPDAFSNYNELMFVNFTNAFASNNVVRMYWSSWGSARFLTKLYVDEFITMSQPRIASDEPSMCRDGVCFAGLKTLKPEFARDNTVPKQIILRGYFFDLSTQHGLNSLNIPATVTKVIIHALTVKVNLRIIDELPAGSIAKVYTIFAREVYIDGYNSDTNYLGNYQTSCTTPQLLYAVFLYSQNTPAFVETFSKSIITRDVLKNKPLRFKQMVFLRYNRVGQFIPSLRDMFPKIDHMSLHFFVYVAQMLADRYRGTSKVAQDILEYVRTISAVKWQRLGDPSEHKYSRLVSAAVRDQLDKVNGMAENGLSKWFIGEYEDLYYVPYLSSFAYEEYLGNVADILGTYIKQKRDLENTNSRMADKVQIYQMFAVKTDVAVGIKQNDITNLKLKVSSSRSAVTKIKDEFTKAKTHLQKTQAEFKIQVGLWHAQKIASSIANFFFAIFSIFTGENAIDRIKGIKNTLEKLAEFSNLIQKMVKLNNALANLIYKFISRSVDTKLRLEDFENVAEAKKNIGVWRKVDSTADTLLNSNLVREIVGSAGLRKAIKDFSVWGGLLTKEAIAHANLKHEYDTETGNLDFMKSDQKKTRQLATLSANNRVVSKEAVFQFKMQALSHKSFAYSILSRYCKSSFFFYMVDCKSDIKPDITEDIVSFHTKILKAKNSKFRFLQDRTCSRQPTMFRHVVTDQRSCTDKIQCPIQNLKSSKTAVIKINTNSATFQLYEFIRIKEIQVYLKGVDLNSVSMNIAVANVVTSRYAGKEYQFLMEPKTLAYSYYVTSDKKAKVTTAACMDGSNARNFNQLSPFTEWTITIDGDPDLSALTGIEMVFFTSATKTSTCGRVGRRAVVDTSRLSISDESPQCRVEY